LPDILLAVDSVKPAVGKRPLHSQLGDESFIVPFDKNDRFTGREKLLETLKQMLCEEGPEWNHRVALYGMGGVGKTQVAIQYVHANRHTYDQIFWITAANEASILSGFQEIAARTQCLSSLSIQNPDQKFVAKLVLSWLRQETNWLIVLDNLDDITIVKDYLPERGLHKHTLISTRNRDAEGIPARGLEVPILEIEESIEMLCNLSDMERQTHELSAKEVVAELQYLPLAIDQAASYVRSVTRDFNVFLKDYRSERPRIHGWVAHGNRQYSHSLDTVWNMSFDVVERELPFSLELLQLLSFLNPDSISLDFLVEAKSAFSKDFEEVVSQNRNFAEALLCLERFSLIRWFKERRTVSIHRLIQAVVKDKMDIHRYRLMASIIVNMCDIVMPGEITNANRTHVRTKSEQVVTPLLNIGDRCPPEGTEVVFRVGKLMEEEGKWKDAEKLISMAITIQSSFSGGNDRTILRFTSAHASVKRKLGDVPEAAVLLLRTLDVQKKRLGGNDGDTLTSMTILAAVYKDQGRLTEAAELYKEALAGMMALLGKDHPSTLISMNNLARVYGDQGRLTEAAELHQEALAGKVALLGKDHPSTLISMNNLARVYGDHGRLTEAAELYKEALAGMMALLGKDHPSTMISMNNLARVYKDQGRLTEAAELHQEALAGMMALLGKDHPSTLISMNNLARVYKDQRRLSEAVELLESALQSRVRILGSEHPDTIESIVHLGAAYVTHGKLDDGIRLQKQALASSDRVLGKTNVLRFEAMSDLGVAYLRQNRVAEAIEIHTRALTNCQNALGPRHPRTLTLLRNLAEDFSCQRRWKEAIESQEKALEGMQSTYGVDHPFTTEGLQKLEDLRRRRMNESASAPKLANDGLTQENTDVTPQFECGLNETTEVVAKLSKAVADGQRQSQPAALES
jgi:tetratricopeptide (TPR) repeat protein